ncbi:retrovirus-related Pol polyprotein from transposon opus [Trichonephila clavipes]|nr:retrovirus-related Pol polyprotein from transposon opus [Trichonephila clavipes]
MVTIHSGVATEWAGLIRSQAKRLELYSRKVMLTVDGVYFKSGGEMAFLGRAMKVDFKCLVEELGETVTEEMKVSALKKLIVAKREDELNRQERDELKRQEREDEIKRQEREDELEKLKIEASMMSNGFRRERNSQNEGIQEHVPVGLQNLMRTFDPKEGEISFYLILFERQARRVHIKEDDWVTNLVGLLLLEMANLIAREPEEKANDYEHIKVNDLTEKLDDYIFENARQYNQVTKATLSQPYRNFYREKSSMCNRRCHTFGEDQSVNTEEEEQEPTITEYDEENGKNTEKFKKQQQIGDTLQEAWNFARRKKGGYVIENDIVYHEELLDGNRIKQLVIPEMRKRKILEIAEESVFGAHLGAHKTIQIIKFSSYWPGMVKEIKAYCSSCHGCHLEK